MAILNRLHLSQKLVLILAVPVAVLVYFAWQQTSAALDIRQDTARLTALSALSVRISSLVHELQKERGTTAGFLGSKGAQFGPELKKQREQTSAKADALLGFVSGFDATSYSERLQSGLSQAVEQLQKIQDIRAQVDDFSCNLKWR